MMSNGLRIRSKLLTIYYYCYNKNSNQCLSIFRLICVNNNSNKVYLNLNNCQTLRLLATNAPKSSKSSTSSSLSESQSQKELTIGEKVKQTTQDVSYLSVILGGISITCLILYAVFRELFSSSSPNVLYSNALKRCKSDPRVIEALGQPIKGFGEMTTRGRRRHVSAFEYEKDGQKLIRVKFYLKGSKRSATVHLETYKNKSQLRYLFVEMDSYPNNIIILEDNRHQLLSN